MWRGMIKVALATVAFGVLHSFLADTWAKERATAHFGERAAHGLYRPVYDVISVLLLGLLVWHIRRQPGADVYHVKGPCAWVMRAGQLGALAFAGWAVLQVGLDFMTGWDNLVAWWRGAPVPLLPDGQGPVPAGDGTMLATGPFAYTRHPLNWFLIPLLWLHPRMTTRLLAFNLVVTAYAVLGSMHVESHLVETYGAAYRLYQDNVPFFAPRP